MARHDEIVRKGGFTTSHLDVGIREETYTLVSDMTPEARIAIVDAARMTHAVPAEEATKQAVEETKQALDLTNRVLGVAKQVSLRHYGVVGLGTLAVVAVALTSQDPGTPIAIIMGAVAGVYGIDRVATTIAKVVKKGAGVEDDPE